MPMSGKLSLGLSEKLGDQVAGDLINEFNAMETARQSEFHALRLDIAGLRSEVKESLAGLRSELKQDMARLETKIAGVQSEQTKWSFVFWLGTVGVVLLLLRYSGQGS